MIPVGPLPGSKGWPNGGVPTDGGGGLAGGYVGHPAIRGWYLRAVPTSVPSLVRGACPTAQVPMEVGDGLLIRLRMPGGSVTVGGLRAIAEVAERFGSGEIELTARANVQIRGLGHEVAATAARRLVDEGLAEADVGLDLRREVMASPLTGHDPASLVDLTATVDDVVGTLAADPDLSGLPPKFCIVIDDGGSVSVRRFGADVALGAARSPEGTMFQIELGRALDRPTTDGSPGWADAPGSETDPAPVWVRQADLAAVVLGAARLCARSGRRMDELVGRMGRDPLLAMLGGRQITGSGRAPSGATTPSNPGNGAPVGVFDWAGVTRVSIGAAPFLGLMTPDAFHRVADTAEKASALVRLTPWRGVVVLGIDRADVTAVVTGLEAAGCSADPTDPVHRISACVGRPGCPAGRADTREAARSLLARATPETPGVHFSGCEKRCGAPTGSGPRIRVVVADEHGSFRD